MQTQQLQLDSFAICARIFTETVSGPKRIADCGFTGNYWEAEMEGTCDVASRRQLSQTEHCSLFRVKSRVERC